MTSQNFRPLSLFIMITWCLTGCKSPESVSSPDLLEITVTLENLLGEVSRLPEAKLYMVEVSQQDALPSDLGEQLFSSYGAGVGVYPGEEENNTPHWIVSYNITSLPAIPRIIRWYATNLKQDPLPQVSLSLPDGSVIDLPVSFNIWGSQVDAEIQYEFQPGSLLGEYTIELIQEDISLTDTVFMEMPDVPMYIEREEDRFWFAGYQPGEVVNISFFYETNEYEIAHGKISEDFLDRKLQRLPTYIGQMLLYVDRTEVFADEHGSFQLHIITDIPDMYKLFFIVQGDTSSLIVSQLIWYQDCSELPSPQLDRGDYVKIVAPVSHYFRPDIFGTQELLSVVAGPFCNNSYSWDWLIKTADGYFFFVPEVDRDFSIYLEPIIP